MNEKSIQVKPKISVPVSRSHGDELIQIEKAVLAKYKIIVEKQASIQLKTIQLFSGAVLCLSAGAVFGASYAKSAGFFFSLVAGMLIGAATTFIYVTWKASK